VTRAILRYIGAAAAAVAFFSTSRPVLADDGPLSPQMAAAQFTAPAGFQVTLFAGEPDVVQPIAFTVDDRGRLWVVECLSYPQWSQDDAGQDRVVIFEDTDGDGEFDERRVFWDRGVNLSGIELGFGGVWLCSTPNLVFIPDRDADDRPDGPPEVVLDGWDLASRHNAFNGLTWGPDGWLYGCNGILSNSKVGAPGTPDDERTAFNCGVWRVHPTRHAFEVVAWGTTNPWGLDFDAAGRMLITNCVIEHAFHVLPGAHFKRMYGQDLNPYVYGLIQSCTDHIHWGGGFWDTAIGGVHNEFGGGHAHAGCMIYLGDNWPDEYRGGLFTVNIHGQRVNFDTLGPEGSGVVASHRPDPFLSTDPWFRGLELKSGARGEVYLTDWNDTGECHDYEEVERGTGRIFRITHGDIAHEPINLAALGDAQLVALQQHANIWHVRHARRLLQEHAAVRSITADALAALDELAASDDALLRLRALWTRHAIGRLDDAAVTQALADPDDEVRRWAIRIEGEDGGLSRGRLLQCAELARLDPSPVVRVELAALLQRLPKSDRWPIARGLLTHQEDADDHNIPLMVWYGIEPLAGDSKDRDLQLLAQARLPLAAQYLARRIGEESAGPQRLTAALLSNSAPRQPAAILDGLSDALAGRHGLKMPAGWRDVQARFGAEQVTRDSVNALSLVFGDEQTFRQLLEVVQGAGALQLRREALTTLIGAPNPRLVSPLQRLLSDADVADIALRGLAAYDDAKSPMLIVKHYQGWTPEQKQAAVNTLAARASSAIVLLEAIESESIPAGDVSAYLARQMREFGDPGLNRRLDALWGSVRATPDEKRNQIAAYREQMTSDRLAQADRQQGRALFERKCAACHRLFGNGATIGPDLTGAQRTSVDYLLENLVDPSAAVPREYRMHTVVTNAGRLLNGVVPEESSRTLTLQTPTERIILDRADIEEIRPTSISMMPERQLNDLSTDEIAALIAYLSGPGQVALTEPDQ